ncbi:MAG TPA: oligosaccharide flippase family protein [Albidovulum sp.]|uniref:lipopolysaccharide biosynthesis protein n=1 Tax=Albidovulum sp. TaxID=1872424 RepID=UPI002C909E9E|nr:oligosaccharide flippase family protein [Albidovulum sp.]
MIFVGGIQVLILLIALVRGKALAIMLGPEGVGVIGTVDQFIITVAQLSALGIPFAAMKSMSAAHSQSEEDFRRTFAVFARILLTISVVVAVVASSTELLAHSMFSGLSEYRDILVLALFAVPSMILTILIAHTFASAQMPKAASIYNLIFALVLAVAALVGAKMGGIWGFYFGTVLAGVAVLAAAFLWLRRKMGLGPLDRAKPVWRELSGKRLIVDTAVSAYANLVSASALLLLVRYVVLQSEGEAEVGLLQSALGVALSAGSILATLTALYLAPSLNRDVPPVEKFRSAGSFAKTAAFYMMLGGLPVALFPGLVLTILYTSAFTGAAAMLILCLIWQGLSLVMTTYSHLLVGIDRPLAVTVTTLVSVAAGIAAVFLLVEDWGATAAPLALIITVVVRIGLIAVLLLAQNGMPMPWGVLARYFCVTLAIGGAAYLFDMSVTVPDAAGFAFRGLYAAAVTGLMWVWNRA